MQVKLKVGAFFVTHTLRIIESSLRIPCSDMLFLFREKFHLNFCSVGMGPDPNKPVCRKAKEIRKERKLQKLKGRNFESYISFF